MSLPIPIPRAHRAGDSVPSSPGSDSSCSASSSHWTPIGVYIPVHKRRSAVGSLTSSTTSSPTRDCVSLPVTTPLIYSRDALLALASSPLSRPSPKLKHELLETVPSIVRSQGRSNYNQQHRPKQNRNVPPARVAASANVAHADSNATSEHRGGRPKRKGGNKQRKDRESSLSSGSERSWRSGITGTTHRVL